MKLFSRSLKILVCIILSGTAYAAPSSELFGHKWYLGILKQESVQMTKFPDQKPYILFVADNTFTAFIGCNALSGTIVLTPPNGLQLTLNKIVLSYDGCKPDHVELEKKFIAEIPNVKIWEIINTVLYLKNKPDDLVALALFAPQEPY